MPRSKPAHLTVCGRVLRSDIYHRIGPPTEVKNAYIVCLLEFPIAHCQLLSTHLDALAQFGGQRKSRSAWGDRRRGTTKPAGLRRERSASPQRAVLGLCRLPQFLLHDLAHQMRVFALLPAQLRSLHAPLLVPNLPLLINHLASLRGAAARRRRSLIGSPRP